MKIADYLLELLYPTKCAFCHSITGSSEIKICESCLKHIEYTGKDSEQTFPEIEVCMSPLYYTGKTRESLRRYKFRGRKEYCRIYADLILKNVDLMSKNCDYITWTPISRKRFRKRHYDQARLIAEELSLKTGAECIRMLEKVKDNRAQSGVGGRVNRKLNVMGVYRPVNCELIKGKRILIVDDIVTTGATLSECAAVLKAAGAAAVCAVTVARSTMTNN